MLRDPPRQRRRRSADRDAPARRRPRVRLAVAAPVPGRGAARRRAGPPAIVVAGDDRAARDLAAALRDVARAADRPLLPEPRRHLRVAPGAAAAPRRPADRRARRAAGGPGEGAAPVVVVSAVALSEKVPDPALRPHGFTLRTGELLDLDETARDLVAAGYERVDQVEDRGQFAIRGGLLDLFPATEDRAVRVDLFGDEIESLRWFSTFTQRSLGDAELRRGRARRRARRGAPRAGRDRRARGRGGPPRHRRAAAGRGLPPVPVARAGRRRRPDRRRGGRRAGARRPLAGRDRRVPRRRRPPPVRRPGRDRARRSTSARGSASRASTRTSPSRSAPRPPTSPRAGSRRPSPSSRSSRAPGYRTVVAFARRGEGERAAYNLGRLKVRWLDPTTAPSMAPGRSTFAHARLQGGLHRAPVPPRGDPRAPAVPPAPCARSVPTGARRRGVLRSFADLRDRRHRRPRGPRDRALRRVRHEDRGRRHARLPVPRVRRLGPGVRAGRPAREDQPLRRRRRRASAAVEARRHALGHDQGAGAPGGAGARRRAAQPVRRAQAARGPRVPARHRLAARVRGRVPVHRDARSARRDRVRQGRHGGAAADGPADLRRRRLRQDRGRAARGVQGGAGRQAGDAARADDDPRPAALRHVHRAAQGLPGDDRARLAVPPGGRAARGGGAVLARRGRHPDRHPPAALARRPRQGPRAC